MRWTFTNAYFLQGALSALALARSTAFSILVVVVIAVRTLNVDPSRSAVPSAVVQYASCPQRPHIALRVAMHDKELVRR